MLLTPDQPEFWSDMAQIMPYWKVITQKGGQAVPFQPRSVQRLLLKSLLYCMANDKDLLHCKARKHGASTLAAWLLHLLVTFRPNIHVGIIANKEATTIDVAKKMIDFYRYVPPHLRRWTPPRDTKVTQTLKVRHPSGIDGEYETSYTSLMSVNERDPGRGKTYQGVLADELAYWDGPNVESAWPAIKNARSKDDGILLAMGTPSHWGDPLHQEWHPAGGEDDSRWVRVFYPWFAVQEYRKVPPPQWSPRADVREYADKYRLDGEQAYYLQRIILPDCSFKWETVEKEYPSTTANCWRRAGTSHFNREVLESRMSLLESAGSVTVPPSLSAVNVVMHKSPIPGRCYVITIDPASSDGDRDYFAFQVMDAVTYEQVAELWCHHHASMMAKAALELSDLYNCAMIVVEANGVGNSLISHIPYSEYSRLFHHYGGNPIDTHTFGKDMKPGWWSNDVARNMAFDALVELVDSGQLLINSTQLVTEMLEYRGERRRARDSMGGHFDRLSAMAIAAWMLKHGRQGLMQRHARLQEKGVVSRPKVAPGQVLLGNQVFYHPVPESVRGVQTPWGTHR